MDFFLQWRSCNSCKASITVIMDRFQTYAPWFSKPQKPSPSKNAKPDDYDHHLWSCYVVIYTV